MKKENAVDQLTDTGLETRDLRLETTAWNFGTCDERLAFESPVSSLLSLVVFKKAVALVTAFAFVWSMCITPVMAETIKVDGGSIDVNVQDNTTNWNVTGNPVWNVPEFNVPTGNIYNIAGLNQNASLALLVNGGNVSNIFGTMNLSNLDFILQNIAGINIGSTGMINLNNASLLASTLPLNLDATQFLAHDYQFGGQGGFLMNNGKIVGTNADLVAMISNALENRGVIEVPMGTVALAAGNTVTVGISPDGMVSIGVDEATANSMGLRDQIKNTGTITADGGRVLLSAKALDGLFENAINLPSGTNANSIVRANNGSVEFESIGEIRNEGLVEAANGEIDIDTFLRSFINTGTLKAYQGDIKLSAGQSVYNEQLIEAVNGKVEITAKEGEVKNTGTIDAAKGEIQVTAKRDVTNDASMTAAGGEIWTISKEGSITNAGTMSANHGTIGLTAEQSAYNQMLLEAMNGKVEITAKQGEVKNTGTITADAGEIDVTARQDVMNEALMKAEEGAINVTSTEGKITNAGTMDASGGEVKLQAQGAIETSGVLKAENIREHGATFKAGGTLSGGHVYMDNLDGAADITEGVALDVDTIFDTGDINVLGNFSLLRNVIVQADGGTPDGTGKINWGASYTATGNNHNLTLKASETSTIGSISGVNVLDFQESKAGSSPTFTSDPTATTWSNITDFRITSGKLNRFTGSGTAGVPYQIYDVYGLQAMGGYLTPKTYFKLADNIAATSTSGWNSGAGFNPVGGAGGWDYGHLIDPFTGDFDGNSKTITGLTINRPSRSYAGLFGGADGSVSIRNVGLVGGNVSGANDVGSLVGCGGLLSNVYNTGSVSGVFAVGGLVGSSSASIANSYNTGSVYGSDYYVGGLVGHNGGVITNSYNTGLVSSGTGLFAGGLVGREYNHFVTDSYWDKETSGQLHSDGVDDSYGKTTAEMQQLATFSGWDIASTNDGSIWGMPTNGGMYPMLQMRYSTTITDAYQLQLMFLNLGATYTLANDIDASETASWNGGAGFAPVGSSTAGWWGVPTHPYTGTFEGGSHTITGLTINREAEDFVGLFGTATGATIQNVSLLQSDVTGNDDVGALVGRSYAGSEITNSHASGTVTARQYLGGLVGHSIGSSVAGSSSEGIVNGGFAVGGLVGNNDTLSSISESYSTANLVSGVGLYAGGLVGFNYFSSISNSHSTGSVSGGTEVGGLVGNNYGASIANSYATGNANGDSNVGGLVGGNNNSSPTEISSITNSYATGVATSSGNVAGGLIGNYVAGTLANNWWFNGTNTVDIGDDGNVADTQIAKATAVTDFMNPLHKVYDADLDGVYDAGEWDMSSALGHTWAMQGTGEMLPMLQTRYSTSITDAYQLQLMFLNLDGTYTLANDIDASGTSAWNFGKGFAPVGYSTDIHYYDAPTNPFTGNFEGSGHTITGLTINRGTEDFMGLFGVASGAHITQVGLVNASVIGFRYVGALVGASVGSTVSNAYSSGTVTAGNSGMYIGGLVGINYLSSAISNSHSSAIVTGGSSSNALGGLVGGNFNSSTITDSYAAGAVTGGNDTVGATAIGGLVGLTDHGGIISNSYAAGTTTGGNGSWNVGGLVGSAYYSAAITDSYSTGAVISGNESNSIGGLVGNNYYSSIANSYSTGSVTVGSNSSVVGGLVGANDTSSITNSFSTGTVTGGGGSWWLGGLIGLYLSGTLTNNWWWQGASSGGHNYGLSDAGNPSDLSDVSTTATVADFDGTGSGTGGAVYSGWDFGNTWHSYSSTTRPRLQMPIFISGLVNGLGAGIVMKLVLNQSTTYSTTTTSGGAFSFENVTANSDDYALIYVNNAGYQANLAGKIVDGGAIVMGLDLYDGRLTLGDTGGALGTNITNADLGSAYFSNSNVHYSVDVSNNVSFLDSVDLWVPASMTYTPGANITATGSWLNQGTFAQGTHAVNFTAAALGKTITSGGSSFYDLTFNNAAGGWTISDPMAVIRDFTLVNGAVTQNASLAITRDYTQTGGTFTATTPDTHTFSVGNDFTILSTDDSFFRYTGDGLTTGTAYMIYDVYGLQAMNQDLDAHYKLNNDIAAASVSNWDSGNGFAPIGGNWPNNFSGSFDGQNHVITDIYINRPTINGEAVGLFSYTSGATIQNVGVSNVNITGGEMEVGGLIGFSENTDITNVYTTGTVNVGSDGYWGGGLVGWADSTDIANSFSTADVTGDHYLGGLAGYTNGGTITDSYATGNVSGLYAVGGLVGHGAGNITRSYSVGRVTGQTFAGGFIGMNFGTLSSNYWDTETSGQAMSNGEAVGAVEGKTSAQMKTGSTFSGWDIATTGGHTWMMAGTPHLQSENTTTITNVAQLQLMAVDLTKNYTLAKDIDASDTVNWNAGAGFVPVGYTTANIDFAVTNPFTGDFDGGGHTITGITISGAHLVGLFGATSGSAITDVGLVGGNVNGLGYYVAGLVGKNESGSIVNSYSSAAVSGFIYVGGLAGYIGSSSVVNSSASGTVAGSFDVGGLLGEGNHTTVSNSYATGDVTGSDRAGGLVGHTQYGSITNSYATGDVTASGSYIGGLAGVNLSSPITNSYALGNVTGGSGSDCLGGLVGYDSAPITNSYATGAVTGGSGSTSVGGLIGISAGPDITNSFSTGVATSGGDTPGGLIGTYVSGTLTNNWWFNPTNMLDVGTGNLPDAQVAKAASTAAFMDKTHKVYDADLDGVYDAGEWDVSGASGHTWAMQGTGEMLPLLQMSYSTDIRSVEALQLMFLDLDADYTLASNIDASRTQFWNYKGSGDTTNSANYYGFNPVGYSSDYYIPTNPFTGNFEGAGHTITGLHIDRPNTVMVGLFGVTSAAANISNVGLIGGSITGGASNIGLGVAIGSLVGQNYGAISGAYNSGSVHSVAADMNVLTSVGGLVGDNEGTITNSYNMGSVSAVATGFGLAFAGGLAALNDGGSITYSYNAGSVSATGSGTLNVGGLTASSGSVLNSYWDTETSGQSGSGGGIGKTTAEMKQQATFSGWDPGTWGLKEGVSAPSLYWQNSYWTGAGSDNNWSTAENWNNNTLPDAGSLVFFNNSSTKSATIDGRFTGSVFSLGIGSGYSGTLTQSRAMNISGDYQQAGGSYLQNGTLAITHDFHQTAGTFTATTPGTNTLSVGGDFSIPATSGAFNRFGGAGTSEGDPYLIYDVYGLQGMSEYLAAGTYFSLAEDIDASNTVNWNASAGFSPIGTFGNDFKGQLNGQSHVITGLYINRPYAEDVGLFGCLSGTTAISDLGLVGGDIRGGSYLGGLAGEALGGTITRVYNTGNVTGAGDVVGSTIGDGNNFVAGGLVGSSRSSITDSYNTGIVSTPGYVGGLVGMTDSGSITNSYNTGSVLSRTGLDAGGLIAQNTGAAVTNSYWDKTASGQLHSSGSDDSAGLTTAQMKNATNFSGWNFTSTWRIYEGYTAPLLKSFLTALTVTANASTKTYDRTTTVAGDGVTYSVEPSAELKGIVSFTSSDQNVGTYVGGITPTGLYSTQQGYDITYVSGDLEITPKALTVNGVTANNKVYDRTTNATVSTGSASLVGVIAGDTATLDASAGAGTFIDKNVGTAKAVTVTGLALTGTDASNYSLSQPVGITADITVLGITVSGVTASNKTYNRTTAATVNTGSASLVGVLGGDTVSLNTAGKSGVFADKNVGTGKGVTVSGLALSGTDASNYSLSQPVGITANITALGLTVSGVTSSNKVYDTTTTAAVNTGSAALVGVLGGDTVSLNTTGKSGVFADKNVGTTKAVTVSGLALSGADASNYTVTQPAGLTANITALAITVSGVTASNKTYDRTTTATVNTGSASLVGVLGGDTVSLNAVGKSGIFADKNVGTGKSVAVSGLALSGTDASNYSLTQPVGITADITVLGITVSGVTVSSKVYDAATTATVNTGSASLVGVLGGDTVSLDAAGKSGVFADKNVGTTKAVTVSGLALSGADASNYSLTQPAGLTADITKASVTLSGITASNKAYDTTTAATISTAGATFTGKLGSDVLTVASSTGTFDDKNVATGKTVTLTNTLGGADLANYNVTDQWTTTASITALAITVSGVTASGKVYDATTAATVNTGSASLVGVLGGDTVSLDAAAKAGAFADKNVGTTKAVTVSGLALSGADASNYSVTQPVGLTADITKATVTLSGITASNKAYDATTAATVSTAGATFTGKLGSDVLTVASSTGTFDDKNVATGKTVTLVNVLGGADLGNYNVTDQGTTSANITAKALTVSGVTADSKVYDATTAASLNTGSASLGGVIGAEVVSLDSTNRSALFSDKNVGTGKAVSTAGFALSGADASNYSVMQPAGVTADITKASVTLSGITASNKVYDATTDATVSGGTFSGKYAGDFLTVASTGVFNNKNVATGKTVTLTNVLGGADLGNYQITDQGTTTADITAKALTISGVTASDKVYDATTTANLNAASAALVGVIGSEDVSLNSTNKLGLFGDKNVGTVKAVTAAGFALSGAEASNYSVVQPAGLTANITKAAVTLSGITAANKVYDSTTTAAVSGGTFSGKIAGDSLTTSTTGVFSDKNTGTGKTVMLTNVLGGADLGNYQITEQGTTMADITAKAVTLNGVTADSKVYDGTRTANLNMSSASLVGVVGTEDVSLNSTNKAGLFSDKNAGADKSVTVSGFALTGADISNYTFSQPAGLSANITKRTLALEVAGVDRVYDGTTAASLTFSDDRVAGDVLTPSATSASFLDKYVGAAKTVNVTGLTLSGADAANYALSATSGTTIADITAVVTGAISGIGGGVSMLLAVTHEGVQKTYETTTSGNGAFTFGGDLFVDAGDAMMVSVNHWSYQANLAGTIVAPVNVTGLNLANGQVSIGSANAVNIASTYTNANLATAKGTLADHVFYSVTNNALAVNGADLFVPAGVTFTPGGNVAAVGDLNVAGTYNQNSNLAVTGDFALATGGTFLDASPLSHTFSVGGSFSVPFATAGFRRYTGTGTVSDPFMIRNIYDLQAVKSNLTSHFKLYSSLDAAPSASWNSNTGFDPIGDRENLFTGSLNGNSKVISNLEVDREDSDYLGLFGHIGASGSVSNLALEKVSIYGHDYVGGLSGLNDGSLSNVYTTGVHTVRGRNFVGGVAGGNTGSIANAYSSSRVIGTNKVGGLVGANSDSGTLHQTYAMGYVTGTSSNVGGLVGANTNTAAGSVSDSFWDVESTGQAARAGVTEGTGKTTAQMMSSGTYAGWENFGTTWVMENGGTYAHFQFRYPEGVRGVGGYVYINNRLDDVITEVKAGSGTEVVLYSSGSGPGADLTETYLDSTSTGASSHYYAVLGKGTVGSENYVIGRSGNGSTRMLAGSGSVYPLNIWTNEDNTFVRYVAPVVGPIVDGGTQGVDATLKEIFTILPNVPVEKPLPPVIIEDWTGDGTADQGATDFKKLIGDIPTIPVTEPIVLPPNPVVETEVSDTETDAVEIPDLNEDVDDGDISFTEESSTGREPVPVKTDDETAGAKTSEGGETKSATSEEESAVSKDDGKGPQWRDVPVTEAPNINDPKKFLTDVRVLEGTVYVLDGSNIMSLLGRGESMRVHYKKSQTRDLRPKAKDQNQNSRKELKLFLKADTQSSIETLTQALGKIDSGKGHFNVLRGLVGEIHESDVKLAALSKASILGLRVTADPKAEALAETEGVVLRLYSSIPEAVEALGKVMEGTPELVESRAEAGNKTLPEETPSVKGAKKESTPASVPVAKDSALDAAVSAVTKAFMGSDAAESLSEEPEVSAMSEAGMKPATPVVMGRMENGTRYGTLRKPGKDVFVKCRGGTWMPAKDGMVILPGDEVKTAAVGSVEVVLDGGRVGRVEIKEGSRFRIEKAETDPVTGDMTTLLDLAIGKILVKVESLKGNSRFEVKSPTALTGVRGTIFEVTVKEKA